jgi:ribonuclease HI
MEVQEHREVREAEDRSDRKPEGGEERVTDADMETPRMDREGFEDGGPKPEEGEGAGTAEEASLAYREEEEGAERDQRERKGTGKEEEGPSVSQEEEEEQEEREEEEPGRSGTRGGLRQKRKLRKARQAERKKGELDPCPKAPVTVAPVMEVEPTATADPADARRDAEGDLEQQPTSLAHTAETEASVGQSVAQPELDNPHPSGVPEDQAMDQEPQDSPTRCPEAVPGEGAPEAQETGKESGEGYNLRTRTLFGTVIAPRPADTHPLEAGGQGPTSGRTPGTRPKIAHGLLAARENWRKIGAEEAMLRGITAEWKDSDSPKRLERARKRDSFRMNPRMTEEYRKLLQEELQEGVVIEIPEVGAKWINPTFLVEKGKRGTYRKVMDCSALNEEIQDVHFKMEGADTVCALIQEGDWATSMDIKSAFNHIPVNPDLQPYLAFQFQGKTYTYVGMPFGIKHAPRVFTLLMRKVMAAIREQFKVRAVSYMDDILFLYEEVADALELPWKIAQFLADLGWVINYDKCEMEPLQKIDFLGWRWNLEDATVFTPPAKRTQLLAELREWEEFAWDRRPQPIRELAAFLGKINALRRQVPDASLHTLKLDRTKAQAVQMHGWDGHCTPNPSHLGEIKWWEKTVAGNRPKELQKPPVVATLTTDASGEGWGASLTIDGSRTHAFGFWTGKELTYSSNVRELTAVRLALSHFEATLCPMAPATVLVQSDNSTTVADINRQSAAMSIAPHLTKLLAAAKERGIHLEATHVPGELNDEADRLSRIGTKREYFLKKEYYQQAIDTLGEVPEEDAFAGAPYLPSPVAVNHITEALRISWTGRKLLIHPPPCLIMKTIQKVFNERPRGLLVLPAWTGQAWQEMLEKVQKERLVLGSFEEVMELTPRFRSGGWRLPPGSVLVVSLGTRTTQEAGSSETF